MFRPSAVIAGWAALNLVLASLMFVFHENPLFVGLYYVAAVPLLGAALLVNRAMRRHPQPPSEFRVGQRAGLLLPVAAGLTLFGLGLIYERWLCAVGAAVVALAAWGLTRPATPAK